MAWEHFGDELKEVGRVLDGWMDGSANSHQRMINYRALPSTKVKLFKVMAVVTFREITDSQYDVLCVCWHLVQLFTTAAVFL